jgi:ribose 5-phosphate isomerase A
MSEDGKQAAGRQAATLVQDGMVVGLGTGSTVFHVLTALGQRLREEGLRIVGVPTSDATARLAAEFGIPLVARGVPPMDLALDGADEVETGTLRLIKGRGGALLREKIIAEASQRFVIVVDESKLVAGLGATGVLPVEVDRFACDAVARGIAAMGGAPVLRRTAEGQDFVTDGGHLILDCRGFGPLRDPFTLERQLRAIAGVIGTGLFLLPVEQAIIGSVGGSIRVLCPHGKGG